MRQTSLLFPAFALAFATIAVGCGDSDGTGSGAEDGTGSTGNTGNTTATSGTGSNTSSSTGTGTPGCEEPTPKPGTADAVPVTTVQVSARDEDDEPIADFNFQLCGTDLCLFSETNMIGTATFTNSQATLDRPLFKPGDSLTYGKIGYPYTAASPDPLVGYFPVMIDSGSQLVPGSTVTAAGATLVVSAGVSIDELTYDEPDKQTFRAAILPFDYVGAATGDPSFEMLYALGPVDTLLCPPAMLTVENYADLDPGTEVEFWGQEVSIEEWFGGYGEWVKLDDGVVSADGATISTTNGLPVLLTVAIKAK